MFSCHRTPTVKQNQVSDPSGLLLMREKVPRGFKFKAFDYYLFFFVIKTLSPDLELSPPLILQENTR